jgi:hypothetical protein
MMRRMLKLLNVVAPVAAVLLVGLFALAGTADAASVTNCTGNGQKCVIKLETGIVGDPVQVLDERAHLIAKGRIVKRQGSYAVIFLTDVTKTVRKGYPVIVQVENRNSNLQWAASFSEK